MRHIREALLLLRGEPEIIRRSPLAKTLDAAAECKPLIECRDALRREIGAFKPSPPPLDPEKVWQRFESSGANIYLLNGLEFRTLCSAPEYAIRPTFTKALEDHTDRLKRGLCLKGLVHSYFSRWRSMEQPEVLERLIKGALDRYPRPGPVIAKWRGEPSLFSASAANGLAEVAVARKFDFETLLQLQYVPRGPGLAMQAQARGAELAVAHLRALEAGSDKDSALSFLNWMIAHILTDTLLLGALYTASSALILSRSAEVSGPFQEAVRNFVQSCRWLGDPRLRQSAPNWRAMEPEARERFLSWLAKESILFFFNTILPPNDHNRRRAEFWLRYYQKITDFQVAISDADRAKILASKATSRLPLHSRVEGSVASAFLLQFRGWDRDYVVVEFSETGNAAYIYERPMFESKNVNLRTPVFQLARHLKHEGRTDRILHSQGGWEFPARQKLAELGIRP